MTKKQLDLENGDRSAVIPWAKHWKRVSLQCKFPRSAASLDVPSFTLSSPCIMSGGHPNLSLTERCYVLTRQSSTVEEEGYTRTPETCDAYWQLVQSGEEVVSEEEAASEMEDDEKSPEAENDVVPSDLAVTSPQMTKNTVWSPEEYENLLSLLKEQRAFEEKKGLEPLEGKKFWVQVAESHRESGYDRTFEGCKTFWNKQGRERSGFDERAKFTDASTAQSSISKSNVIESKPASVSAWSSVNGAAEESGKWS